MTTTQALVLVAVAAVAGPAFVAYTLSRWHTRQIAAMLRHLQDTQLIGGVTREQWDAQHELEARKTEVYCAAKELENEGRRIENEGRRALLATKVTHARIKSVS